MAGARAGGTWQRSYSRKLLVSDVAVIVLAMGLTQIAWFGLDGSNLTVSASGKLQVGYTQVSILVASAWIIALQASATRDGRVVGSGFVEYKRVSDATIWLFALFAIVAYLAKIDLARGYFLTALPLGLFLLLLSRWLWRQGLHRARATGNHLSRVLLVGAPAKCEFVAGNIQREPSSGLDVVAAAVPSGANRTVRGVPDVTDLASISNTIERLSIETIVLVGSDELSHNAVRSLTWELEERDVSLIVIPALTDVAGPRIHTRPVAGLPLIYVEFPTFLGRKNVTKRIFDVLSSVAGIVVLSPLLVGIAIAVKADTRGPAFFKQERIGRRGRPFRMYKFRSMTSSAEEELTSLLDRSEGNGVLFKMRDDPRVTRVGRFLRKNSLDELPQLLNVLKGDMSLVGPRPPLASEVAQYDQAARRRLLVKPGITGLWQVSGRSDLSWDDSIRLDLYYVENWSMTEDLILLYRTLRAVLRRDGAY